MAAHGVLLAAKAGVRCRMVIAGAGPGEGTAQALAAANPEVIQFRGFAHDPRRNVMPELDLLAVMSSHEGLPMSIIEAMSVGLPVAGTKVGGIPEAIQDGVNGFLVERSAEALARCLQKLAQDVSLLRRVSASARKSFEERFEISSIVRQYHALYEEAAL